MGTLENKFNGSVLKTKELTNNINEHIYSTFRVKRASANTIESLDTLNELLEFALSRIREQIPLTEIELTCAETLALEEESDKVEAEMLTNQGYAITSRKHRIAMRIDRKDWKDFCIKNDEPVDADFYRRVLSKDSITVSQKVLKHMHNSSSCDFEYKPMVIKVMTDIENTKSDRVYEAYELTSLEDIKEEYRNSLELCNHEYVTNGEM